MDDVHEVFIISGICRSTVLHFPEFLGNSTSPHDGSIAFLHNQMAVNSPLFQIGSYVSTPVFQHDGLE